MPHPSVSSLAQFVCGDLGDLFEDLVDFRVIHSHQSGRQFLEVGCKNMFFEITQISFSFIFYLQIKIFRYLRQ